MRSFTTNKKTISNKASQHPAENFIRIAKRNKSNFMQESYLRLALRELQANQNLFLLAYTYYWLGNVNNSQSAQETYYFHALKILHLNKKNNITNQKNVLAAKIYIGLGNTQTPCDNKESYNWFKKALALSNNTDVKRKAYIGLANAYRSMQNNHIAKTYAEEALKHSSSDKQTQKIKNLIYTIEKFAKLNQKALQKRLNSTPSESSYHLFSHTNPLEGVIKTIQNIQKPPKIG